MLNDNSASCSHLCRSQRGNVLSLPKLLKPNGKSPGKFARERQPKKTPEEKMRTYQELVDAKALIIFPMAFLLFNIGYWVHYLVLVLDN